MSWYSDGENPSQFTLIHSGDADLEDFGIYEDEETEQELKEGEESDR